MNKILYRDYWSSSDELLEKETLDVQDIIYISEDESFMVIGFEITRFGLMDLKSCKVLSCRFRSLEDLTNYIRKFKVKDDIVHIAQGDEWTIYFP